MDKKPIALIPYQSRFLAPHDAIHISTHIIIPNSLGYEGEVTIALTPNELWVVTPDGQYEAISLRVIEDVKLDNFPGFVYKKVEQGVETLVAPNDTAGVTIEYRTVGRLKSRLSFLTRVPNLAHQWIRRITQTTHALYQPPPDTPTDPVGDASQE